MGNIAIVTDSNSGITQAAARELGVRVLPMPFYINEELFFEDVTLTQEAFYQRLAEDADISTSQPAPGDVTGLWDELLESYDQIVYIPMSSGSPSPSASRCWTLWSWSAAAWTPGGSTTCSWRSGWRPASISPWTP